MGFVVCHVIDGLDSKCLLENLMLSYKRSHSVYAGEYGQLSKNQSIH